MRLDEFFALVRDNVRSYDQDASSNLQLVRVKEGKLWEAANALRAETDPEETLVAITQMLFLRVFAALGRLTMGGQLTSDTEVMSYFVAASGYESESEGSPPQLLVNLEQMYLESPVALNIDPPSWQLRASFDALESAFTALRNIVSSVDCPSPESLAVEWAALARAYEGTVLRVLTRSWTLVTPTPRSVIKLMIGLTGLHPGDRVLDPACGSAMILAHAATSKDNIYPIGLDISPAACIVATGNLLFQGCDIQEIIQQNSLTQEFARYEPDVIFSHVPFGAKVPRMPLRHSYLTTDNVELLLLERIMDVACERGIRAAVVVSDRVLFAKGAAREVRGRLVQECGLQAVISLPKGIFKPNSAVKASLLIIDPSASTQSLQFYQFNGHISTGGSIPDIAIVECISAYHAQTSTTSRNVTKWKVSHDGLARNNYDLQAKEPDDDSLEHRLQTIPSKPLGSVTQRIDSGMPYSRSETIERDNLTQLYMPSSNTNKEEYGHWVPFLRVSDLTRGGIRPATLLIDKNALRSNFERIKAGDILVSVSGTIGKIALCTSQQEGFAFSQGLTRIRCSDETLPSFLATYLKSGTVQTTLRQATKGATIQHLPISELRKISVPMLPLDEQRRLVGHIRKGGDVVESIAISRSRVDFPVSADAANVALGYFYELRDQARLLDEQSLENLIHDPALRSLRRFASQSQKPTPDEVQQWVIGDSPRLDALLNAIRDVAQESRVVGSLATAYFVQIEILALTARRLRAALATASPLGTISELDRAILALRERDQTRDQALEEIVGSESARYLSLAIRGMEVVISVLSESILSHFDLSVRIESDRLTPNEECFVRVIVENAGWLPITDVVVDIPELAALVDLETNYAPARTARLDPGEKYVARYRVQFDRSSNVDTFARWAATDLHYSRHEGEAPVTFALTLLVPASPYIHIERNPYITGTPVAKQDMFFGREDVIAFLQSHLLGQYQNNVVLLEGNRRTGKSSILKQVVQRALLGDVVPVYIDCQGLGSLTEKNFYYKTAHHIYLALEKAGIEARKPERTDFSDTDAFWEFRQIVEVYLSSASGKPIAMLFDEFEYLDDAIKRGELDSRTLENLRHLFQHYDHLAVALTGSHRLTKLREEYWSALFGLTIRKDIGALDHASASALVSQPLSERVQFTPDAVEMILSLTDCQPYFIQMVCHTIVADLQVKQDTSVVTPGRIESVIPTVLEAASEHLKYMVSHAKLPRQQALLAFVAEQQGRGEVVTWHDLTNYVESQEISVTAADITQDMALLQEHDLVRMERGLQSQHYRVPIDLVRRWASQHIDLEDAVAQAKEDV